MIKGAFSSFIRCADDHVSVVAPDVQIVPYITGGLGRLISTIKTDTVPDLPDFGYHTSKEGHFKPKGKCLMGLRYSVKKILDSKGQSAVIVLAEDEYNSKKLVVIKVLHSAFYQLGAQESHVLCRLSTVDPLNHSHTLRLLNILTFDSHYCMVFEPLLPDPLTSIFQEFPSHMVLQNLRKVGLRLLATVGFLHQQNLIHTDLKPENILLKYESDLDSVHVVDFGNCINYIHSEVSMYYKDFELQTPLYRAPEVMFGVPFGPEIDMWSLGCILAELYTGEPLFMGTTKVEILDKITKLLGLFPSKTFRRGKYYKKLLHYTCDEEQSNGTVKLMEHLQCRDMTFADLLSGLLRLNPDERLTANQAACHPFFASHFPVAFLQSTTGANSSNYLSVCAPAKAYTYSPEICADIKKGQPTSLDLLRMGTSELSNLKLCKPSPRYKITQNEEKSPKDVNPISSNRKPNPDLTYSTRCMVKIVSGKKESVKTEKTDLDISAERKNQSIRKARMELLKAIKDEQDLVEQDLDRKEKDSRYVENRRFNEIECKDGQTDRVRKNKSGRKSEGSHNDSYLNSQHNNKQPNQQGSNGDISSRHNTSKSNFVTATDSESEEDVTDVEMDEEDPRTIQNEVTHDFGAKLKSLNPGNRNHLIEKEQICSTTKIRNANQHHSAEIVNNTCRKVLPKDLETIKNMFIDKHQGNSKKNLSIKTERLFSPPSNKRLGEMPGPGNNCHNTSANTDDNFEDSRKCSFTENLHKSQFVSPAHRIVLSNSKGREINEIKHLDENTSYKTASKLSSSKKMAKESQIINSPLWNMQPKQQKSSKKKIDDLQSHQSQYSIFQNEARNTTPVYKGKKRNGSEVSNEDDEYLELITPDMKRYQSKRIKQDSQESYVAEYSDSEDVIDMTENVNERYHSRDRTSNTKDGVKRKNERSRSSSQRKLTADQNISDDYANDVEGENDMEEDFGEKFHYKTKTSHSKYGDVMLKTSAHKNSVSNERHSNYDNDESVLMNSSRPAKDDCYNTGSDQCEKSSSKRSSVSSNDLRITPNSSLKRPLKLTKKTTLSPSPIQGQNSTRKRLSSDVYDSPAIVYKSSNHSRSSTGTVHLEQVECDSTSNNTNSKTNVPQKQDADDFNIESKSRQNVKLHGNQNKQKMLVSKSEKGKSYDPVPSLQNQQKWKAVHKKGSVYLQKNQNWKNSNVQEKGNTNYPKSTSRSNDQFDFNGTPGTDLKRFQQKNETAQRIAEKGKRLKKRARKSLVFQQQDMSFESSDEDYQGVSSEKYGSSASEIESEYENIIRLNNKQPNINNFRSKNCNNVGNIRSNDVGPYSQHTERNPNSTDVISYRNETSQKRNQMPKKAVRKFADYKDDFHHEDMDSDNECKYDRPHTSNSTHDRPVPSKKGTGKITVQKRAKVISTFDSTYTLDFESPVRNDQQMSKPFKPDWKQMK